MTRSYKKTNVRLYFGGPGRHTYFKSNVRSLLMSAKPEAGPVRNPLAKHPWWRQLLIVAVVLPLVIILAVLAFAWPSARLAPRGLPVGIVGTSPASQQVVAGLTRAEPGGFSFSLY